MKKAGQPVPNRRYTVDYQFDVYDAWCETALPGGVFGFPTGLNPVLKSWSIAQWKEALQGLLGKYDQCSRDAAELSDRLLQHALDTLEENGLLTAMHWLLLKLDHTSRYVRQIPEIEAALWVLGGVKDGHDSSSRYAGSSKLLSP